MDIIDYILLFITGCVGGTLAGLIGVGGGIIYVVALSYYFDLYNLDEIEIVKYILSNSAFAVFFAGLSASIKQKLSNNYYFKEVLLAALPAMVSAILVSALIIKFDWYSRERFTYLFVAVLALFVYRMFSSGIKKNAELESIEKSKYSISGFIMGIFSALSGLGGGVIMVPVLSGFFKLKIKKVTSISLGAMPFFTLAVTIYYALTNPPTNALPGAIGYIMPQIILPMVAGVIIFSPFGVKLSQKLPAHIIRIIFSAILILVIIKMVYSLYN
jgi:uncharacterized membrane protein YfcA